VDVSCDDGRRGILSGDCDHLAGRLPIEPDGPRHPGVIIGNKSSVIVGQGVFVGQGKGRRAAGQSERAQQSALPGARWRVVLLLKRDGVWVEAQWPFFFPSPATFAPQAGKR